MTETGPFRAAQSVRVYRAEQLRVVNGANLGDGIGIAEDLVPDDIYRLSPVAAMRRLSLYPSSTPPFSVAPDSEVGQPGADLHLDCVVTFMSGDGETTDALILVETDPEGAVAEVLLLPLGEMSARRDYALVGVSRDDPLQVFARVACVSFTRGTMITLASGAQRPVEALRVGDRVLTRDDGPQPLRWIGHHTVRAVGVFAPVLIRAGVLNNSGDLLVSPDHRLFIYQREDRLGAGRAEVLVKARHLVNGDGIRQLTGGFVDYYQMLFDHHQIVFAEGIAAESMLVDTRTRAALPEELGDLMPDHRRSDHGDLEVRERLLDRPDLAELLRGSSRG